MSNATIQKINSHLESSKDHVISVFNTEDNSLLVSDINLKDLNKNYGSIETLLSNLISKGFNSITINRLSIAGNLKTEVGEALNLHISTPNENPKEKIDEAKKETTPMQEYATQTALNYAQNQNMGSSLWQEKYMFLKETHVDLKEDYRDLKDRFKKVSNRNWELEAEVKSFEKDKDYALKLQAIEKAGFLDSEGGQLAIQEGLGLLGKLAANKSQTSQLAAPEQVFTEAKSSLINSIKQENVGDMVCQRLAITLFGFQTNNKEFIEGLENLINTTLKKENGE